MVRVWLAYSSTRPSTPILVSQVDLSETFEDFMHVGFTASNGEGSSDYTGRGEDGEGEVGGEGGDEVGLGVKKTEWVDEEGSTVEEEEQVGWWVVRVMTL
ncbi:hypothetical protein DEO72_LG10g1105 [Vigna unguiculata]|uniref:Uncharacterized protein n=1 Tax=Vigna unguiculata TaxID=3917 RepID=A0A4D6NAG6_VIGUN|nr:hypothetical protein DEO72_LG10g1105 [Vigna unguiculata]